MTEEWGYKTSLFCFLTLLSYYHMSPRQGFFYIVCY